MRPYESGPDDARGCPAAVLIHGGGLVEFSKAITLAEAMAHANRPAELYLFDGLGELHGIWREERPSPRLAEHIEDRIAAFINHLP